MTTEAENWETLNQRRLVAELARVRAALERRAGQSPVAQVAPDAESLQSIHPPTALARVCEAFRLTPFERDVLLLCAGTELESRFTELLSALAGPGGVALPTFGLALAVLEGAHWSALSPASPLRYWRLVEVQPGPVLSAAPVRIDERILHYLTGVPGLDERLLGLVRTVPVPASLPTSHQVTSKRLADNWASRGGWPTFQLSSADPEAAYDVAADACAGLGIELYAVQAADLPASARDRDQLARLWERETSLGDVALLIDADRLDATEAARSAAAFADRLEAPLLIYARDPIQLARRRAVRVDVSAPSPTEQGMLWRSALGPNGAGLNGELDRLVAQFTLGPRAIEQACASASRSEGANPAADPAADTAGALWEACRVQARSRLDDLAQRIDPAANWDDLVVPELQRDMLRDLVAQVRQRATVYSTWGFAARCPRGLGITALFAGPSGTGKTMAAEVIAGELRLDLYRVDLSAVVSKYIGETEKNLRRVFDAAEAGGAVLLFDEADALFGKRSEVRDSHDRYANLEVSYLLQRMESYRGLAVLTTNQKQSLDDAFIRRLRFIVSFPFPDRAERAEIWRRVFPPGAPTENLSHAALARLNVTGGHIRNIALYAAFLAADAGEPVRMSHLLRAAQAECAELERPLTDIETGGWV